MPLSSVRSGSTSIVPHEHSVILDRKKVRSEINKLQLIIIKG